jgi:hypothetical protein
MKTVSTNMTLQMLALKIKKNKGKKEGKKERDKDAYGKNAFPCTDLGDWT